VGLVLFSAIFCLSFFPRLTYGWMIAYSKSNGDAEKGAWMREVVPAI